MADIPRNLDEALFLTNPLRLSDKLTLDDYRQSVAAAAAEEALRVRLTAQTQYSIAYLLCEWARDYPDRGIVISDPLMVAVLHSLVHEWLSAAVEAGDERGQALAALLGRDEPEAPSEASQGDQG